MSVSTPFTVSCPGPAADAGVVLLAHGEGARFTRKLIREILLPAFDNPTLRPLADAAVLPELRGPLVVTTDGFVVTPLFFPGGDIGRLAVHGTVNDLAVSGAEPLYLTVALVLEEGLPFDILRRLVASIRDAAQECGVAVVAGDTKVVPRGAADQVFITTTGVGRLRRGVQLGTHLVRPGDAVLVSGTLGDHGIAILNAREGFAFAGDLTSDVAPLHGLAGALHVAGISVRWMRDLTRGGLSAALHELVEAAGVAIEIEETSIPVSPAVRGACEVLGLDPIFVANEGKLVAVVASADAERALTTLRALPLGANAARVGRVVESNRAEVVVRSALGSLRVLDEPAGAPLPRIC